MAGLDMERADAGKCVHVPSAAIRFADAGDASGASRQGPDDALSS